MIEQNKRRNHRRLRVLKGARIVFNERRSVIDCTVRDLSPGGALLLLPSTAGIPNEFELWVDNAFHTAHIIRKGNSRIAVAWSN